MAFLPKRQMTYLAFVRLLQYKPGVFVSSYYLPSLCKKLELSIPQTTEIWVLKSSYAPKGLFILNLIFSRLSTDHCRHNSSSSLPDPSWSLEKSITHQALSLTSELYRLVRKAGQMIEEGKQKASVTATLPVTEFLRKIFWCPNRKGVFSLPKLINPLVRMETFDRWICDL